MYDLAGNKRNTIAPDLPEYIMDTYNVRVALRKARDLNLGEDEWNEIVKELENRKG